MACAAGVRSTGDSISLVLSFNRPGSEPEPLDLGGRDLTPVPPSTVVPPILTTKEKGSTIHVLYAGCSL
jgi:hypothetical protein